MYNNTPFDENELISLFITYLIPNTITDDKATTSTGLKFLNNCDPIYYNSKTPGDIKIKQIFPDLCKEH
jgi:hypothetical protein